MSEEYRKASNPDVTRRVTFILQEGLSPSSRTSFRTEYGSRLLLMDRIINRGVKKKTSLGIVLSRDRTVVKFLF